MLSFRCPRFPWDKYFVLKAFFIFDYTPLLLSINSMIDNNNAMNVAFIQVSQPAGLRYSCREWLWTMHIYTLTLAILWPLTFLQHFTHRRMSLKSQGKKPPNNLSGKSLFDKDQCWNHHLCIMWIIIHSWRISNSNYIVNANKCKRVSTAHQWRRKMYYLV